MATTTVRIPVPRRRWPVIAIVVIVVLFLLFTFLSSFYVDVLWYREVGLSQVFWTRIWAQAGLAAAFFITFFVLLLANLLVTRRLAPKVVALTPSRRSSSGSGRTPSRTCGGPSPRRRGPVALRGLGCLRSLAGVPAVALPERDHVRRARSPVRPRPRLLHLPLPGWSTFRAGCSAR